MDAQEQTENMQDYDHDDDDDTLSLCDLPIYGDAAADGEELAREEQSSSSSEQDYFEFFSEQWSTTSFPANDVVFCGKLITYREQPPVSGDNHRKLESNKQRKHENRGGFRWNFMPFNKSNTSKLNESKGQLVTLPVPEKYGYDFPVGRVSIVAAPAKSRWYLLMFGLARFPAEMELRDIRKRQSRRSTTPPKGGGGEKSGHRSRGFGLWGLIGALGCGGGNQHVNAAVKASYGCAAPRARE